MIIGVFFIFIFFDYGEKWIISWRSLYYHHEYMKINVIPLQADHQLHFYNYFHLQ